CLLGKGEKEHAHDTHEPLSFSLAHSVESFLGQLKQQFCLSHKRFGWFKGKGFPLEKFLSPFLLQNVNMRLTGLAYFEATFDERFLIIFYQGQNFCLDSPSFCFKADHVREHLYSNVTAVHYIDLKTWDHMGFLPFNEASYWQKNYNFRLENAK